VSTNLALTVRKAISLCLSVWYFGSGWNGRFAAGASFVFGGSLAYALASRPPATKAKAS
jgi:solute carrier family 35 (UDP-xylose/UDP-N-acetylglucosamine transporter), member B4